jgi:hypothetical protein
MKNIRKQLNISISVVLISLTSISCNEKKTVKNTQVEKSKSEEKFGLSEDKRKELFKETVTAEDKANAYQRVKQDSVLNLKLDKAQLKEEYDLIEIQSDELMRKYKTKVMKKYNITEKQEKQISFEGLEKKWQLE